jgi:dTDP-4-amino-4,6-dideoxygalactose transaminase
MPLRAQPPGGEPIALADVLAALGSRARRHSLAAMLETYLSSSHVLLTSSGTAALVVALRALQRLRPGRPEVVLPAYTCPNLLAAVVVAGLEPVLCDVSPDGTSLDAGELPHLLTPKTLAVVCVHLFGVPADLAPVAALAKERRAYVIEDAAQAFGNEDAGRKLGTLGDVGIFSFGRGKPLTLGAGGALATGSQEIAGAARSVLAECPRAASIPDLLRALLYAAFFRPSLYWLPRALPFLHLGETRFSLDVRVELMSPFSAALGTVMLPRYGDLRRERAWRGLAMLARLSGRAVAPLANIARGNAYLRLPLLVEAAARPHLLARLGRLGATGMYPVPLGRQPGTAPHLGDQATADYPNARRLSERLLTLPLHAYLREGDLRRIEGVLGGATPAPVMETT